MQKIGYALLLAILLVSACHPEKKQHSEFRAVWVATVNNIDWPKKGQIDPDSQRQAFLDLLDFYAEHHFNAVIVQIRTAGDALYPTDLAPWSRFLTGKEGKAPDPWYDPLAFMIEACHQRDLEFHAWLNPYRATTNSDTSLLSPNHVLHQHPEWIIPYGNKNFLNPGVPAVRQQLVDIIGEVCQKYPVDGIHFDDYFYPYKIEGEVFDDSLSYAQYGQSSFPDIEDWRRHNVNQLIRELQAEIRRLKPGIPFGISPFGVWRNADQDKRGSRTYALQTNYDDLYADCLTWMEEGWIDYIAPQLYFSMDYEKVAYRELAHWWARQGKKTQTPVYAGIGTYKVENNHDSAWYDLREIPRQLVLNQQLAPIEGIITFSAKSLLGKVGLAKTIQREFFQERKLAYVRNQREEMIPRIKTVKMESDSIHIEFSNIDSFPVESVVVYANGLNQKATDVLHRIRWQGGSYLSIPFPVHKKYLRFAYLDQHRSISTLTNPILLSKEKKSNAPDHLDQNETKKE